MPSVWGLLTPSQQDCREMERIHASCAQHMTCSKLILDLKTLLCHTLAVKGGSWLPPALSTFPAFLIPSLCVVFPCISIAEA